MNCSHCNHGSSRVVDTKDFGHSVTRYRICRKCGKTFATKEAAADLLDFLLETAARYGETANPVDLEQESTPIPPVEQQVVSGPKTGTPKTLRYRPADPTEIPPGVEPEAVPLLLQWWNESRWSRHGSNATWTKAAFLASADRLAAMSPKAQISLAMAGVESGWQALKPQYGDSAPVTTGSNDFTPTDPRLMEALNG